MFPLVVTRDERDDYISALEAADHGNLKDLVDLFTKLQRHQFIKAAALAENMISAGMVLKSQLENLKTKTRESVRLQEAEFRQVFDLAKHLEDDTEKALNTIKPDLQQFLLNLTPEGASFVRLCRWWRKALW